MFSNWLRTVFSPIRNRRTALRKRARPISRPNLVQLEDRATPAVIATQNGATLEVALDAPNDTAFLRVNAGDVEVDDEATFTGAASFAGVTRIEVKDAGANAGQSVTFTGGASFVLTNGLLSIGVETVTFDMGIDATAGGGAIDVNAPQTITVNAGLNTSSGPIDLAASRNIAINNAGVQSNSGAITLTANQGATAATGSFSGISVIDGFVQSSGNIQLTGRGGTTGSNQIGVLLQNGGVQNGGVVKTTGSGAVTVQGTGGASTGFTNHGVFLFGTGTLITSGGGNVSVTGTGGGAGTSNSNHGVFLDQGTISAGGSGTVSVTGTGGTGPVGSPVTGGFNRGVLVAGSGTAGSAQITSGGGGVTVTGTGGGSAAGSGSNIGVLVSNGGVVTAGGSGTVGVTGTGGPAVGGANDGIQLNGAATQITSGGGAVTATGTGGGAALSADNVGIYVSAGTVSAGGSGAVGVTGTAGTGSSRGIFLNGTLTSTAGIVSVTGTGGGGAFAVSVSSAGALSSGGPGDLTITTDSLDVHTASGTIRAGGTGNTTATIRPQSATTKIDLGGSDVLIGTPLTLGISNAELGRVAAGKLVLSDATNTGGITVSAAVTAPGTLPRIDLVTGAAIADGNAVAGTDVAVGKIGLTAGTGIGAGDPLELDTTEVVSATVTGTGNISLNNASAWAVTNVQTANGSITLSNNSGDTTLAAATAGGGGAVSVTAAGAIQDDGSNSTAVGGGTVTLTAGNGGIGAAGVGNELDLSAGTLVTNSAAADGAQFLREADSLTWNTSTAGKGAITLTGGRFNVGAGQTITTPAVTVTGTAILGGGGKISGAVTANTGGKIAPGFSPGVINTGDLTLNSGSTLDVEIGGTTPGAYDQVNVTGSVTINGATLTLTKFGGFTPGASQSFVIINNDKNDDVQGTGFAGLPEGTVVSTNFLGSGLTARITYQGGDGNDVVVLVDGPLTFTGTPGNDQIEVRRVISGKGDDLLQVLVGGVVVESRPTASVQSLTVNGGAGNDTLTVNYGASGGFFPTPVTFNGDGPTTAPGDALVITGGTFAAAVHSFTTTGPNHSGNIVYNTGVQTGTVTYTGLEPVDMTGSTITDLVFNLPGTNDQAILEDAPGANVSQIRSQNAVPTFDTTTFATPLGSLTVNMGGDSGTLTVGALDNQYDATLVIDGQGGAADVVNVNGALTLGSGTSAGNLVITAETIDINAAAAVGGVALTADNVLTIDASITAAGNISAKAGNTLTVAPGAGVVITAAAGKTVAFEVDTIGPADAAGGTFDIRGADLVAGAGLASVTGGAENDQFFVGKLTADLAVNGGGGNDTLTLDGGTKNDVTITGNTFSLGGGTVTPAAVEVVVLQNLSGTELTVTGTAAADTLEMKTDAGKPSYVLNGGPRVYFPAGTTKFTFLALGGKDVMRVLLAAGEDFLVPDIRFDGSDQAGDTLVLAGGGTQTLNLTLDAGPPGLGSGTAMIAGETVKFSGLSPVDVTGMAVANVDFKGAANIQATVAPGKDFATNTQTALVVSPTAGGPEFEATAFWNNGTVNINTTTVAGVDVITVTGTGGTAHNNTNLSITTGAEAGDLVTFTGSSQVAGKLTVSTTDITVNAGVAVTAGGDLTYTAAGNIANSGNAVSTAGAVTMNAAGTNNAGNAIAGTSVTLTGTNVTGGTLSAGTTISATATTGNIINFSATAGGNITFGAAGSITTTGATTSTGGSVTFTAGTNVTAEAISGKTGVSVTATGGTASLNGAVSSAAGPVSVSAGTAINVNNNVQGAGTVTLTTGPDVNDAGNVQNITIAAGKSVTSTGGDVVLSAADYLIATGAQSISAPNGAVTMSIDTGGAVDAAGGKAFLSLAVGGDIVTKTGATLNGNTGDDEFTVTKYSTNLTINGGPGFDTVCLDAQNGAYKLNPIKGTTFAKFVGGGSITMNSIERVCLVGVQDIVVEGDANPNNLLVASNGGAPYYILDGNKVDLPTNLVSFTFLGGDGSDTMIVEISQPGDTFDTIADALAFDGQGADPADVDCLAVVDKTGTQTAAVFLDPTAGPPADPGRGTVTNGGKTLTFTEVEAPVDVVGFGLAHVTFAGAADLLTVAAGTLCHDNTLKAVVVKGTTGGLTTVGVALRGNVESYIDTTTTEGVDEVTVNGTGAAADHLNGSLIFNTGTTAGDKVTVAGVVEVNKDFRVSPYDVGTKTATDAAGAETIAVNAAVTAAGNVYLQATGTVTSTAAVTATTGFVRMIAGNTVTNSGPITAAQAVELVGTGGVTNSAGVTSNNATVLFQALGPAAVVTNSGTVAGKAGVTFEAGKDVTNSGAVSSSAGPVLFKANGGTVTNSAAVNAATTVTFKAVTGAVQNNAGGTVTAGGNVLFDASLGTSVTNAAAVTSNAGNVTFQAATTVTNSAPVTATAGSINFGAGTTVTNNAGGTLAAGTDVTLAGTTGVSNAAGVTAGNNVAFTATAGQVSNSGTVKATAGTLTFSGQTVANVGAVEATAKSVAFTATAGDVINSGPVVAGTTATFTAAGAVQNLAGGTVTAGGNVQFTATGTDVANAAAVTSSTGSVTFQAQNNVTNSGAVAAKVNAIFVATAGAVTNSAPVTATTGAVTFTAGTVVNNAAGGTLAAGTDVTLTGPAGVGNAAAVNAGNNVTFTAANASVSNSGPVTASAGNVAFAAGQNVGNSGTVQATVGSVTFQGTAGSVTNTAAVAAGANVAFTAGNQVANGGAVTAANGSVAFQAVNAVTNNAFVNAGTNVTFTSTAASVTNSGLVVANTGNVSFSAQTNVVTTQNVSAGQTVTLAAATGSVTVSPGVVLEAKGGNVVALAGTDLNLNGAVLTAVNGTVTLAVDTDGAADAAGGVANLRGTGIVTKAGLTATVTGNDNDDQFFVDAGYASLVSVDGKGHQAGDLLDIAGTVVSVSDCSVTSPGRQFLTFVNVETVVLSAGAQVTALGDGPCPTPVPRADRVVLSKSGAVYLIDINGRVIVAPALTNFAFSGGELDDCLLIDPSVLGTPVFANGIAADGGAGADAVSITGTGTEAAVYTPDAAQANAGRVVLGANKVTVTNTEGIDLSNVASATVTPPNGNDVLTLSEGTDFCSGGANPAIRVSGLSGGVGPIPVLAVRTAGTLLVDTTAADGNDTVTVAGANNAHGVGNLEIRTGAGADAVNVAGNAGFAGTVTVTTVDAKIAAGKFVTAGGPVTVIAAGAITNNGTVTSQGGAVALQAAGALTSNAVNAATGATLSAGGALTSTVVTAGANAVLVSAGGSLTSGSVTAGGSAGLQAAGDLTSAAVSAGTTAALAAGGAVASGTVVAGGNVTVSAGGGLTSTGLTKSATGTVTLAAGGAITLGGNVIGNGNVLVQAIDAAGAQTVTVQQGKLVQSEAGTLTIRAGDDLTAAGATLQAGGAIALEIDAGNADPGVGATADLRTATILAPSATLAGGDDADLFRVTGYTSPVLVDGNNPTAAPGDVLEYDAQGKAVTATVNSFNTAGAPLTYTEIETVVLLNATVLGVVGGPGDDTVTISQQGGKFAYQFAGQPVVVLGSFPASFRFDGLGGKDALIVSYAGGDPVPAGGVVFDGGADVDLGLCVLGTGGQTADYLAAGPTGGTVTVDGKPIAYANLDVGTQVDIAGMKAVTVRFASADDVVEVTSDKLVCNPAVDALIVSGPAFTKIGLANNGSVTLDTTTVDGNDTVTVTQANNAHGNTNLAVLTGAGNDLVAVNGPTAVAGNLTLTTQSVALAPTVVTAGGAVTVNNAKALAVTGGVATITAGAGGVLVAGPVEGPGGLAVNTPGATVFQQAVGAGTPLASLATDPGGTTRFDGGLVRTVGAQTYADSVTFTTNTTFQTGGGPLTFAETLAPAAAGLNLTLGAATGDIGVAKNLDLGLGTPTRGSLTINGANTVTLGGTLTAGNLTQQAGAGTTRFAGAVDLSGSADLVTTNVAADAAFAAATGNVSLKVTGDVTFNGPLTTQTLTQTNGGGTTTFNGPATLTVDGANLTTGRVEFNSTFAAAQGSVLLTTANGAAQSGAGVITTQFLDLRGAGVFDLDNARNDVTAPTGGLFANLASGAVQFRDANALDLRFRSPADPTPAIRIGGTGSLELTAGGRFEALDQRDAGTRLSTPLIDVGAAGTVQVYLGADLARNAPNAGELSAEVVAATLILGTPDTAADRANKSRDAFTIRPSQNARITVHGNLPTRFDPDFVSGDSLGIELPAGISRVNLQTTGPDSGVFSFPGTAFKDLEFTSIETLGGTKLEGFVVQTAPRVGAERNREFVLRVEGSISGANPGTSEEVGKAVPLGTPFTGGGTATNPFVVSPQVVNPAAPFTGPRIAFADVDGLGTADLIIASGSNDLPIVTVIRGEVFFSGAKINSLDPAELLQTKVQIGGKFYSALITQFFAYEPGFSGGIVVAAGDLNNDGKAEIVTGPGFGGGQRVRVFTVLTPNDQNRLSEFTNTVQYDGYRIDPSKPLDANNRPQLALDGNGKPIREYEFLAQKSGSFFAFDENPLFRGGVNVAVGDIDGDTVPDVVVGAGVGGGPRVQVYSGRTGSTIRNFFAYDENFRGGVYVDAGFYDGDEYADILTAPGPSGGPHIRVFRGYGPSGFPGGPDGQNPAPPPPRAEAEPAYDFFAYEPIPGATAGDREARAGVSDARFGSSTTGDGRNRTILVATPRGREFQVFRFTRTADGVTREDLLDPNVNPEYSTPGDPQFIGVDPDTLRDGGSVSGS